MLSILIAILFNAKCIMVVGHRGNGCSHPECLNQYPENSIPSYLEAIRVGADAVELDVWISRDNQVVVTHRSDPGPTDSLNASIVPEKKGMRTPLSGEYLHSERHKNRVKAPWSLEKPDSRLYLSDEYTKAYEPPLYIPLLATVFKEICPTGKKIIVELKGDNPEIAPRVLNIARMLGVESCIHTLSSFYWKKYQNPTFSVPADLFEPIRNITTVRKALLFNRMPSNWEFPFRAAEYYGAQYFHPHCNLVFNETFQNKIIEPAHRMGMNMSCYFSAGNPDTEPVLRQYVNSNMDEICTNNPGLLRRILDEEERKKTIEKMKKKEFIGI